MTTYGSIPASTPPTEPPQLSTLKFISRAKHLISSSGLGAPRPWKELVSPIAAFSRPGGCSAATERIYANAAYFRVNYAIVVSVSLLLSLLLHPTSLVIFGLLVAAWLFLYFLREGPLVIFDETVDDILVIGALCVVTYLMFFLTSVTVDVALGMAVGLVVVLVHGALRSTEELLAWGENNDSSSTSTA
ncbi:hypothetical protein NMG60_11013633 [Bertholletia excelsa]